jgi:diaminopimelate decarboxylase
MVRIARDLTDMGVELEFIDLGGGLGIPYHHDTDPAPTPEDYAARVCLSSGQAWRPAGFPGTLG